MDIQESVRNLIDNFIIEFDKVFGQYLDQEELFKRLEENMGKIRFEYIDEGLERFMGRYNPEDKSIELPLGAPEGQIRSAFFYQMMHYVTTNQVMQTNHEQNDNQIPNNGFNEAFIQYATHLRDLEFEDLYNYENTDMYFGSGRLLYTIASIYGKDEFLRDSFNNPSIFIGGKSQQNSFEISNELDVLHQNEAEFREHPYPMMSFFIRAENDKKPKQDAVEKAKLSLFDKFMQLVDEKANPATAYDFEELCDDIGSFIYRLNVDSAFNEKDMEIIIKKAIEKNISSEKIQEILSEKDLIAEGDKNNDSFNILDIGKATINTDTDKKDQANQITEEDMQKFSDKKQSKNKSER